MPEFDAEVVATDVEVETIIEPATVSMDVVPEDIVSIEVTSGIPGPPGIIKVEHGADANVARPNTTIVYWVGTVQPNNAHPDDLLMLK